MKNRLLLFLSSSIALLVLMSACASPPDTTEVDQRLKALFDQNEKFQKLAISKIGALEKDVKTLKANQAKLAKQIPAIVKQIRTLRAAVAKAGQAQGVTPEMEAQLNDILTSLELLEADLADVKESGVPMTEPIEEPVEELDPIEVFPGSDQELVLREYGRPAERYTIDNKNQVWLYDNGVVVFDLKGSLISLKFE